MVNNLFYLFSNLFLQKPREFRQASLQKQFNFLCSCEACKENYPLAKDLQKFDEYFEEPVDCHASEKEAVEAFHKNCIYINKNHEKFPCYEICRLMQNNFNILQMISSENFSQKKDCKI